LPKVLQELIRKMAAQNPTWGEERIANELKLKLGIRVSPRTVQKYLCRGGYPGRKPDPNQRWLTLIHNHAKAIAACDFFVVVTATIRVLYVFLIVEVGRRRILHHNITAHPTAEWTLQQFREALPGDHPYRFVIHDQDNGPIQLCLRATCQEAFPVVAQLGGAEPIAAHDGGGADPEASLREHHHVPAPSSDERRQLVHQRQDPMGEVHGARLPQPGELHPRHLLPLRRARPCPSYPLKCRKSWIP
jgi:hypothetical protein